MKKQVHVVMLPTEKATQIGQIEYFPQYDTLQIYNGGSSIGKPQHLYFLSDDEIKEGDWIYDEYNNRVYQATDVVIYNMKSIEYEQYLKKIIATTDDFLRIESTIRNSNENSIDYGKVLFILPRPSNEFLKKYCELGGIDKVLVEYYSIGIGFNLPVSTELKVAPDNTITIYPLLENPVKSQNIK